MLIDRPPEPERPACDLHDDFIQMSDIARSGLPPPQVAGDLRPEFDGPAPDSLVGYVDAALEQHFLHLPQAQIEPEVEPNRVGDDLGWKAVALVADVRRVHCCQLWPNRNASKCVLVCVTTPAAPARAKLRNRALGGMSRGAAR